jgi:hypothetical protein
MFGRKPSSSEWFALSSSSLRIFTIVSSQRVASTASSFVFCLFDLTPCLTSSIPNRLYQTENKTTRLRELEEPCQRFKRTLHGRAQDGNRFRDRCENRE